MRKYGPYKSSDNRDFYIYIYPDGTRKSVWAYREIMEEHLGRKLKPTEIVHHKNEDCTDNRIENLEIMSLKDHSSQHAPRVPKLVLTCVWCGKVFERAGGDERHNRKMGHHGPFCGNHCAGKYGAAVQNKRIEPKHRNY